MAASQLTLVLGLGESGLAMARWLARQGVPLRVADSRETPPGVERIRQDAPAAEVCSGPFAESLLAGVARLAISPGLDPRQPLVVEARRRGIPVVGEMDLLVEALDALGVRSGTRIIAITGTNGKTTTTALAGEMARATGVDAVVAGNISPAALDVVMTRQDAGQALPDVWVLELSSFQLETGPALNAAAATVLNVTDDHLDRYAGLADYAATKAAVFQGQGVQVLNRQDRRVTEMARPGRRVWTFGLDAPAGSNDFGVVDTPEGRWLVRGDERLLRWDEMQLAGSHNVANALAALALGEAAGLPRAPMIAALKVFPGLPHRVEKVAERGDGVIYYDDSKGTNVGATVAALEGLSRKVFLVVGGDGKGQDFSPLKEAFARYARAVVLIGRDARTIEAAVAGCGVPLIHAADMDAAVRAANARAEAGDVVLLSPACASLDMFRNYAHRAQVFIDAVLRLPGVHPA
ncbi:UDP-N-acetylmuramoyl-L-alanine--D-glutamate ligase [Zoogloea sp.]|uniref:UDP-N-acetylmuramoyl-L-alanine--D-glutamate ligase n=1 Tax=Zoogloea sp. TaxID=49181 RepID=UPI0026198EDD|nr:UDP-N-acetylmuramoyl-L-alanine--D-glutamate ligase [Zoogloea sp.]MDD3353101.1 UDP-N-acetylmuramoyl-L-alanine--D-glutamate ligase [Zoogloea sp.]